MMNQSGHPCHPLHPCRLRKSGDARWKVEPLFGMANEVEWWT